jgi:hypothetical protein
MSLRIGLVLLHLRELSLGSGAAQRLADALGVLLGHLQRKIELAVLKLPMPTSRGF